MTENNHVKMFRVKTNHNSTLYYDHVAGEIRHQFDVPLENLFLIDCDFRIDLLVIESEFGPVYSLQRSEVGWVLVDLHDAGAPNVTVEPIDIRRIAFRHDREFLCATPEGTTRLSSQCFDWECFTLELASVINSENWRCVYRFSIESQQIKSISTGSALSRIYRQYSVVGPLETFDSLACVGRRLANMLNQEYKNSTSIFPRNDITKFVDQLEAQEKHAMLEMLARKPDHRIAPWIVIHHGWPLSVPVPRGDLTLAYFFWEESQMPEDTVRILNLYDAILVPSKFVAEVAIAAGVKKDLHYIGYAPDLSASRQIFQRRRDAARKSDPYTFLHVSSGQRRKGVDVLLTAFARAFTSGDAVRLIIKTLPLYANNIKSHFEEIKSIYSDLPEIIWVNKEITESELMDLYLDSDVMVLPTRGEGFNIPAAEAVASGLGLIVTGFSGHMDFCNSDIARFIRYDIVPAKSEHSLDASFWAEPDVADLALALKEFFAMRPCLSDQGRAKMLEILNENMMQLRILQAVSAYA